MREFWVLVAYLLVALRRALTVAWIRLNKFISSSDGQIRPVTDFRHKVWGGNSSRTVFGIAQAVVVETAPQQLKTSSGRQDTAGFLLCAAVPKRLTQHRSTCLCSIKLS